MSSGIESLSDEGINDYVFWTLNAGLWDGRMVSLEEAAGFFLETKSRIEAFLFSHDPDSFDFKKIALSLAWIGSQPQEQLGLINEIKELQTLANGTVVAAKSKHKDKKSKIENPYDLDRLRKFYDEEVLAAREILIAGGLPPVQSKWKDDRSFCQKYARQILVAAVIVAIVATLIVVSVSMAGTTSGIAAAAGSAAINGLQQPSDEPKKPPQSSSIPVPSTDSLAVEPISIPTQTKDIAKFSAPILPSLLEEKILSSLSNQKSNPNLSIQPTLPETIDVFQPLTSNFPWMNESISYLLWRERQLQEELLTSLLHSERTISEQPALPFSNPIAQPSEDRPFVHQKPNFIREFVELVEKKLGETADPNYITNLQSKDPRPDYGQQFIKQIEEAIRETSDSDYLARIADPNYLATMQVIEQLFPQIEMLSGTIDNYASSLSSQKPAVPFQDIPLLGCSDQSTIHFHCGISNNFSSIVESGLCLKDSLDNKFAVQPHLIHSNNIVSGVTFVGLEKLDITNQQITSAEITLTPNLFELAKIILENSQIQRSIDYEVESLSQIAQNIIKTGKPNLKQLHVTFSNGGYVFNEALKQLPPEYQETIMVVTTGTTAIIDEKLAHKVYNVIGDKDWASLMVNGAEAVERAREKGILEIISQSETLGRIGGHYSIQPDYQKKIAELTKDEIIGKYEIY